MAFPLVQAFQSRIGGNVATMVAIFTPLAGVLTALAVDTGLMASKQRQLQGLADLAAISAARDIEDADKVAKLTLALNGFAGVDSAETEDGRITEALEDRYSGRVQIETGRYTADAKQAFERRFTPGMQPANAVRVTLKDEEPRYFSLLLGSRRAISVSGTAAVSSEAAISVGSRLLSLEDGIVNLLLSELTGSEVSLTVMDYRGLASVDIDLLEMFDALASNIDLDAATYDDVLDSDVSLAGLAEAMAEVSGDTAHVAAALTSIAGERGMADVMVPLQALIDLGSAGEARLGTPAQGLDLGVEALQLLTAAAFVSNGENQVALDIDLGVPGLANVTASLQVGERPQSCTWFSVSEQGRSIVSTVQTRLFLDVSVNGLGLLSSDLLRLPLYLELASAEASVTNVVCAAGSNDAERVDVDVRPGILTLRIADLDGGFASKNSPQGFEPAEILHTRLINVRAVAESRLVSPDARTLRFHRSRIGSGEPLSVSTREALSEALESAIRDLDLEVDILGLSLVSPSVLQDLIGLILAEAVEPVDTLVFELASALGLSLGEADVWVHDARCNRSVLVQ